VKKVVLCEEHAYYIADEDYERLKRVSPATARLVKATNRETATHFACEDCGQISPLKLRHVHRCGPDM